MTAEKKAPKKLNYCQLLMEITALFSAPGYLVLLTLTLQSGVLMLVALYHFIKFFLLTGNLGCFPVEDKRHETHVLFTGVMSAIFIFFFS